MTELEIIQNLMKCKKRNLSDFANFYNISIFKNGKRNKGWKGQTIERISGLSVNSRQERDHKGFELKSVEFKYLKNGRLVPKETMAITMINQKEIINTDFFNSHLWNKISSMIFCSIVKDNKNKDYIDDVIYFNLQQHPGLIKELKEDYNLIKNTIINKGFDKLSGRLGKWIQPRTKGSKGSKTRAFYARKNLINIIKG